LVLNETAAPVDTGGLVPTIAASRSQLLSNVPARTQQDDGVTQMLDQVVTDAEGATIVALRDALIDNSGVSGATHDDRAGKLTDELLVDTACSECCITQRIAQAIDTIQQLLWSARSAQLRPPLASAF